MQLDAIIEQLPQVISCEAAADACSNNSYSRVFSLFKPIGHFIETVEVRQDPLRSQKEYEGDNKGSCKPKR